ncbi:MAG: response regulator transcription factor [Verrucomicrobiota bacterium]
MSSSHSPASPPITVALVEDNPRIRSTMEMLLGRDPGIELLASFSSGEEALAAVPRLRPKVLLMDINLPGMSGVECVRQLAGTVPGMQILMLTVHEDSEAIFSSLAAGATGYLVKPPSAVELLAAIRDVHAGGAPMTSSIARRVVQSFTGPAASPRAAGNLSPREIEVLDLLVQGLAYKEVAARLDISYSTVHRHIERIYSKLHVHSRTHAVAKYLGA